jgi:Mg-chelatase subunit ChlD
MKTQSFPYDPESRITALLLGELEPAAAAEMRAAIAQDPELARLHDQLKETIAWVRQTLGSPAGAAVTPAGAPVPDGPGSPLRLSDERRQRLLEQFQTLQPPRHANQSARAPIHAGSWQLTLALAAVMVGLLTLTALILPGMARAKSKGTGYAASSMNERVGRLSLDDQAEAKDGTVRYDFAAPQTSAEPGRAKIVPSGGVFLGRELSERGAVWAEYPDDGNLHLYPGAARGERLDRNSGEGTFGQMPSQAGDRLGEFGRVEMGGLAIAGTSGGGGYGGFGGGGGIGGGGGGTVGSPPTTPPIRLGFGQAADPLHSFFSKQGLQPAEQPGTTPAAPPVIVGAVAVTDLERGRGTAEDMARVPTLGDRPSIGERYGLGLADQRQTQVELRARSEVSGAGRVAEMDAVEGRDVEPHPTAAADASSAYSVPLDIELPIPAFMGTPTDLPVARPAGPAAQPASAVAKPAPTSGAEAQPQVGQTFSARTPNILSRQRRETELAEAEALLAQKSSVTSEVALGLFAAEADHRTAGGYEVTEGEPEVVRQLTAPEPQPEAVTADGPFSTFSLNVTDVSFKLALASLQRGQMPQPAAVRSEEFINAFDYQDPEPSMGRRVGLVWERAQYPFAHQRDVLRIGVKTAALGREPARPLNLVLCLDSSGSMERADRVQIVREALAVLAGQLQPADQVSVIAFARTARLWVDALPGDQGDQLVQRVRELAPEGGTNLEEALHLAYATAARHHRPGSVSRVVLLTDGAANLGDVDPESLRQFVITQRKQGIALDCFGVGWEGYHDDLLETLSRNGDGRYGFLNTPEETVTGFATQLAGALQVAASDVKVQIEFNPQRVRRHRLIGYAKHQLTQEQFRDNTVDAAELGAAESGNALYVLEIDPAGRGPIAAARVRFKVPGTERYEELEWMIPFEGTAPSLDQASPALRLAASAGAFAEWLGSSPHAAEVTPRALLQLLRGVPESYPLDHRPQQLEQMIQSAGSISGR